MGNGIDKSVVLFVAADFAYQKDCIEYDADDDERKENNSQDEQRDLAPVEQDPTDIESDGKRDEARPEGDEENYGLATASYRHGSIVKAEEGKRGMSEGAGGSEAKHFPYLIFQFSFVIGGFNFEVRHGEALGKFERAVVIQVTSPTR